MNLIEIAEDLKDLPDQYLMQEIQQPTGNFPSYLIVSELGRRKRMRDKVAKEMPSQTVAARIVYPSSDASTDASRDGTTRLDGNATGPDRACCPRRNGYNPA
jgi:hypothetical protein